MTQEPKLKPCPFCGGENIKHSKMFCQIICQDCFSQTCNINKVSEIDRWNTRHQPKEEDYEK
jgi:hypothetical protein